VGYCFGRKKDYRYNGKLRQEYIMAALTPRQIEEMKDTKPSSNLDKGPSYLATMGKTRRYHHGHGRSVDGSCTDYVVTIVASCSG
jgi:hypothetical protein